MCELRGFSESEADRGEESLLFSQFSTDKPTPWLWCDWAASPSHLLDLNPGTMGEQLEPLGRGLGPGVETL